MKKKNKEKYSEIRIEPDKETREALIELADADDRPVKAYVERIVKNYVKEIKGEKQTTNY